MRSSGFATFVLMTAAAAAMPAHAIDWNQVNQALGREGAEQPGGVHRYGFPRTDLSVTIDGVKVEPGLALGSWLAFHPLDDQDSAMVMGDLVLTQEEVAPVMKRLSEGAIDVTALHNHLLRAEPFPMYMHIEGHGDAVELAQTLREAIVLSGTPLEAAGGGNAQSTPAFDTNAIAQALGREGKVDGTVYKYNIERAQPIREGDMIVPVTMGTGIAINVQDAGDGNVATTGDFVLAADEVQPVIQALTARGLEMTALHNHMLNEEPRMFFMHFWGVGAPEELASGLKNALDRVAVQQAAANP